MIDSYSVQLITTLLDGSATALVSPGQAETGGVLEAFGGMPQRIAAGASDVNIKLGTLADPLWLAVFGNDGITFRLALAGQVLDANPFAFLADEQNGLGISEIWVSNSDSQEQTIILVAAE